MFFHQAASKLGLGCSLAQIKGVGIYHNFVLVPSFPFDVVFNAKTDNL